MRQDQLERARQARWRQDGNALLTVDDAERWLAETPLCLYLPRRAHLPVPAPSFVEAVAGRADATPGPERIAAAADMLARLVASGAVVALNLFGAAPGIGVASFVGEHPDFLATPQALPYLYAMQPDRNPKRAPSTTGSGRVSPLAAEAYKLLEREGALTTDELRQKLGREVTEAAVLRSLAELWHTMRVVPVPSETSQEGAHWELLSARHRRELTMGSTQQQTSALSILASFYLQSAVAATDEEIEIFLSPVASRSRIRDVVHGLSATRQLASFPLNGAGQLYVEGTLPEVAEDEPVSSETAMAAEGGAIDAGLEQNEPSFIEAAASGSADTPQRPAAPPAKRPYTPRPAFGDRARTGFAARPSLASSDRPPRREGAFRKPGGGGFRRSAEGGLDRPRTDRPRSSSPRTDRPRSERPPRTNRFTSSGAERRPGGGFRGPRPSATATGESGGLAEERRPSFTRGPARSAGVGRPVGRSGPGRSGPAGAGRPPFRSAGASPQGGFRKPGARPEGGYRRAEGGADRPPRPGGFSAGSRFGGGKPRPEGAGRPERPFRKREGESDRPRSFAPSAGEGRAPRAAGGAAGDRPFKKPYAPRPDRPRTDRPRPDRPRADRPAGDRPFKKPYAPRTYGSRFERPAGGSRPYGDRPRSPRPAAAGDGPPRRSFTPPPRPDSDGGSGAERRPYTPRMGGAPRGKGPGASFGARSGGPRSAGAFGSRSTGPRPEGEAPRERTSRPGAFKKPSSFAKPGGGFKKAGGSFGKTGGFRKAEGAGKPGGFKKTGGFSKPGGAGKRFAGPRATGAGSAGAGPRPAGTGRPTTTGGFSGGGGKRPASPRPGSARPGSARSSNPRSAGSRPGGFAPPRRKPRTDKNKPGDEG